MSTNVRRRQYSPHQGNYQPVFSSCLLQTYVVAQKKKSYFHAFLFPFGYSCQLPKKMFSCFYEAFKKNLSIICEYCSIDKDFKSTLFPFQDHIPSYLNYSRR